jgi:hypothetical protein
MYASDFLFFAIIVEIAIIVIALITRSRLSKIQE